MIELQNVTKRFGAHEALVDASLTVRRGELLALLGPSGGGKTTLLRVIAGLESPDDGCVLVDGVDLTNTAAHTRAVGFVFQHFALFREMSVLENVAFGLRVRPRATRPSDDEIRRRARALLGMVQLEGLAARYPDQLSGGQRQRVALARALAVEPKVLLLDEPFGALDARVRHELRAFLRRLHDSLHTTTVLVTHDRDEALDVADRVAVIEAGRVHQVASPEDIVSAPTNDVVRAFIAAADGARGVVAEDGRVTLVGPTPAWPVGTRVRMSSFASRAPHAEDAGR